MGLLIGISGMVTFKQAHNIRKMAAALSAAHVMVETDAPFLAPVPYRGRRNEPAYAALVGKRLAEEDAFLHEARAGKLQVSQLRKRLQRCREKMHLGLAPKRVCADELGECCERAQCC